MVIFIVVMKQKMGIIATNYQENLQTISTNQKILIFMK